MNPQVFITQRAKRDIREIVTWIKARSLKGAKSWLAVLEKTLGQLPKSAASSAAAVESNDFGLDMRQRLFKTRRGNTYRLVFTLHNGIVHILAVRGAGQDLLQQNEIEIPE